MALEATSQDNNIDINNNGALETTENDSDNSENYKEEVTNEPNKDNIEDNKDTSDDISNNTDYKAEVDSDKINIKSCNKD